MVATIGLGSLGGAAAQPGGDPAVPGDQPSPSPDIDPVDEQARELYDAGELAYSRGHYDDAVAKFQAAYDLSKRPLLLFNLANTYERMGAYDEAAATLRRYVGSPDAVSVEAVRQRIRHLDARATESRALDAELATLRSRPPCADQITCPTAPLRPPSNRTAFILLGTGAIAVLAGGIFGLVATSAGSDASDQCVEDGGGTFCSGDAANSLDRERLVALAADVSLIGGTVAAATGAFLWWRNRNKASARERSAATWSPVVSPQAIGVGLAGWF